MPRPSRRSFIVTGGAGLVSLAAASFLERARVQKELQYIEFRSLEVTTPLRRRVSPFREVASAWKKSQNNPVLGGALGTCFDAAVLRDDRGYAMWFSWRNRGGIGYAASEDGVLWTNVQLVLPPRPGSNWRVQVNRPTVVKVGNRYLMWYTGQTERSSVIGFAESEDGILWRDVQDEPVFASSEPWEAGSVMCPNILYEEGEVFKMWYSAGGQFEPMAIGYAESENGIDWVRHRQPVFTADTGSFDSARVAGANVVKDDDSYLLFYIGFRNIEESAICVAKSASGYSGWVRHPGNPILAPGEHSTDWDYDAVYRPTVLKERDRWILWYNGRLGSVEQIGFAAHDGLDLGFPPGPPRTESPS